MEHDLDAIMNHYPIAIVEDRDGGFYSSGKWLAISTADAEFGSTQRVTYVLNQGPHGTDGPAQDFWFDPPEWIAVGDTPDAARDALIAGIRPTPFRRAGDAP
jgi:hypothetical protein